MFINLIFQIAIYMRKNDEKSSSYTYICIVHTIFILFVDALSYHKIEPISAVFQDI